jgi:hypothetical protein
VLEHTHSPRQALRHVFDVLKPGGRFMLAVPNFGGLQARILGPYWCASQAPRHLYQFTRRPLTRYLENAGFENVRIYTRTGPAGLVQGFRHAVNGLLGTRWRDDPAWMLKLAEIPAVLSCLVRCLGMGCELRVTCDKPASGSASRRVSGPDVSCRA